MIRSTGPNYYQEGRTARAAGRGKDECPYPPTSFARTGWLAGWMHRNAEIKRETAQKETA